MPTLAEIARIKAEIAKLKSDLKVCTDSQIRKLIEMMIDEWKRKLARLRSSRRGPRAANNTTDAQIVSVASPTLSARHLENADHFLYSRACISTCPALCLRI